MNDEFMIDRTGLLRSLRINAVLPSHQESGILCDCVGEERAVGSVELVRAAGIPRYNWTISTETGDITVEADTQPAVGATVVSHTFLILGKTVLVEPLSNTTQVSNSYTTN